MAAVRSAGSAASRIAAENVPHQRSFAAAVAERAFAAL
jgi:hypothetical protein